MSNKTPPANGDGNSWASAYQRLDLALYIARPGDQLWVAKGTYTPAQPNGNRAAAFALKPNVNVYGGFIGNETSMGSRLPGTHQTILSGDLNGDDDYLDNETADLAENSYHVVAGATDAILDGFTIQAAPPTACLPMTGAQASSTIPTPHRFSISCRLLKTARSSRAAASTTPRALHPRSTMSALPAI